MMVRKQESVEKYFDFISKIVQEAIVAKWFSGMFNLLIKKVVSLIC